MKDGLKNVEKIADTFSGTTILASIISGADIAVGAGTIGVVETSSEIAVAYTGSPSTGNTTIQVGSFNASNVAVAVPFATPFTNAPKVVMLSLLESGLAAANPGHVVTMGTGSFNALGESGLDYSYIAVGEGRV